MKHLPLTDRLLLTCRVAILLNQELKDRCQESLRSIYIILYKKSIFKKSDNMIITSHAVNKVKNQHILHGRTDILILIIELQLFLNRT